ncbi:MAG TPA: response regulator transcription factor [Candidatus Baltobacteraceae bacterium]|jgi:DNA-binding NarL/FixJ family response regulator
MIVAPGVASTARVFVVGKDQTVSRAISKLLELDAHIEVLGHAPTLGTVPIGRLAPDVVILDVPARAASVAETRTYLGRVAPSARVALLEELRGMNVGEMIEAVRNLAPPQTAENARHLMAIPAQGPLSGSHDISTLSERELEVVRLVAEGLSNKEISSRLSLSDKTVKNHISHILAKMNLTARTQVAVYAIRAGLV